MIKKLLVLISTFLFCATNPLAVLAQSPGPTDPDQLEVFAPNGADHQRHLVSHDRVVPLLMVRPSQTVPLILQFSSDKTGSAVAATPLDGGEVGGGNMVISPTGQVVFSYRPGATPGRYRLLVVLETGQYLLEFYVVDPANPPFRSQSLP